jgi:3-oxoacyl-(acyl-carrier-protein) synthase
MDAHEYTGCTRSFPSGFSTQRSVIVTTRGTQANCPTASATALQYLEIACDIVLFSKTKVMIAGGFGGISKGGSYRS